MAVATHQNGQAWRGQDALVRFTVAADTTGWTLAYTAMRPGASAAAISVADGDISDTPGATSTVDVAIAAADLTIAPYRYRHELWRVDSGDTYPLAVGELVVRPSTVLP